MWCPLGRCLGSLIASEELHGLSGSLDSGLFFMMCRENDGGSFNHTTSNPRSGFSVLSNPRIYKIQTDQRYPKRTPTSKKKARIKLQAGNDYWTRQQGKRNPHLLVKLSKPTNVICLFSPLAKLPILFLSQYSSLSPSPVSASLILCRNGRVSTTALID